MARNKKQNGEGPKLLNWVEGIVDACRRNGVSTIEA